MKQLKKKAPTHIAMRIGSFQDRPLGQDVVEAHNEIAERNSSVFFGKAGRIMSQSKLQQVRDSLAEGNNCRLILVRRSNNGYQCYTAPIISIPSDNFRPNLRLVPEYYHDLVSAIRLWMEVGQFSKADSDLVRSLALVSNSRSLLETLNSCRTSLMLVKEGCAVPDLINAVQLSNTLALPGDEGGCAQGNRSSGGASTPVVTLEWLTRAKMIEMLQNDLKNLTKSWQA